MSRIAAALSPTVVRRALVLAAVAAAFLALIGPFNTSAAPLWVRLFFWESVITLGTGIGVATAGVVRVVADPDRRRPFLAAGLGAVVMTPLTALMAFAATRIAFGSQGPGPLVAFLAPTLVVCLAMALLNALANREPQTTRSHPGDPAPPRFLERLPPRLRGAEIYAVKAEDHYLRIHTSRGSDLILMRLTDAIAELDGLEGAQTHRSWWVSRSAVQSATRADGRAALQLPEGLQAPVSRNFTRALREAGWLG